MDIDAKTAITIGSLLIGGACLAAAATLYTQNNTVDGIACKAVAYTSAYPTPTFDFINCQMTKRDQTCKDIPGATVCLGEMIAIKAVTLPVAVE